jgi:hypothetical protein
MKINTLDESGVVSGRDFGAETLEINDHPMGWPCQVTDCQWKGADPAIYFRYVGAILGRFIFQRDPLKLAHITYQHTSGSGVTIFPRKGE